MPKHAVQIFKRSWILRSGDKNEIRKTIKISVNVADCFARLLIGGDKSDFGIRVEKQDTEQLRSAISRPSEDPDSNSVTRHRFLVSLAVVEIENFCVRPMATTNS